MIDFKTRDGMISDERLFEIEHVFQEAISCIVDDKIDKSLLKDTLEAVQELFIFRTGFYKLIDEMKNLVTEIDKPLD